MPKVSKRQQLFRSKIVPGRIYTVKEALSLLKELAIAKFKESFDVSINLGVEASKSDQNVRGATVLPNGTGKTVRVAVFAENEAAQRAREAGAEIVGFDDLAADIKAGKMDFDVLIATPAAMRLVGQLGQILGPRGLMPNPKVGTVAPDAEIAKAVKNAKAGQVRYRTDKAGIIHCSIGKADFEAKALAENLNALLHDLQRLKPAAAKGQYFKKITLSTTMGPGVPIDIASISEVVG